MILQKCPACGKLYQAGLDHKCAIAASKPVSRPVPKPIETKPEPPTVIKKPRSSDAERVAKWRAANPERYRTYMREYMAKRAAR